MLRHRQTDTPAHPQRPHAAHSAALHAHCSNSTFAIIIIKVFSLILLLLLNPPQAIAAYFDITPPPRLPSVAPAPACWRPLRSRVPYAMPSVTHNQSVVWFFFSYLSFFISLFFFLLMDKNFRHLSQPSATTLRGLRSAARPPSTMRSACWGRSWRRTSMQGQALQPSVSQKALACRCRPCRQQ